MKITKQTLLRLLLSTLSSVLILICIATVFAYQTDTEETLHSISTQDEVSTTLLVMEKVVQDISPSTKPTELLLESTTPSVKIEEATEPTPQNEFGELFPTTPTETISPPMISKPMDSDTTEPPVSTSPPETSPAYPETGDSGMINMGTFILTAYCPCYQCCGIWSEFGLTATGTVPVEGRTIAVDPDVIPYGTQVIINGHTYIAEDCGSAIKENRIDVFFNSHEDALIFGIQTAEVKIIKTI